MNRIYDEWMIDGVVVVDGGGWASDTETSAKRVGNLDEGGSGVNGVHEDSEVDVNEYWWAFFAFKYGRMIDRSGKRNGNECVGWLYMKRVCGRKPKKSG